MTENEKELIERLEASNDAFSVLYHDCDTTRQLWITALLINNINLIKKVKDEDTEEDI